MKICKIKNQNNTLRMVVTDDKSSVIGIVGTINDLIENSLISVTAGKEQYSRDTYMCIPNDGFQTITGFGETVKEAVEKAVFSK